MRGQWNLIFALIFALIIAIFSVLNYNAVDVNLLFTTAKIPLVLVILASTLFGGIIVGSVGLYRQYTLQKQVRILKKTIKDELGEERWSEVEIKMNGNTKHTNNNKADEVHEEGNIERKDSSGNEMRTEHSEPLEQRNKNE